MFANDFLHAKAEQRKLSMARAILRSSSRVIIVAVIFMRDQRPPAAMGSNAKQSRKITSAIQPRVRRPGVNSVGS